MPTCPKCFKPSPTDAAFCGFCGSALNEEAAPQGADAAAKTVFGYNFGPGAAKDVVDGQPASADGAGSLAQTMRDSSPPGGQEVAQARTDSAAVPKSAAAASDVTARNSAGEGLLGGKYWLGGQPRRLPVGELFQARDIQNEQSIEILVVDAKVFQSPLDLERARRELRQIQKITCPGIVKVIDHDKNEQDQLFIVMEPVDGRTLEELVADAPLDLVRTRQIIGEIGTALAEAQKMGVIHRDIAPHNVLVTADGAVQVRGFGIAAPIKKQVWGTPEYISPEQASGRPVDQRSNIYSLGALMFFMLTREPPFTGDTEQLLNRHRSEEPVPPSQRCPELTLPPRADALILKALAKSSSRRHLTLRQFLREVESLAAASGEAAPPSTLSSFETPLHGVTALQADKGAPPPQPPAEPQADASQVTAELARTMMDTGTKSTEPSLEPQSSAPAVVPPAQPPEATTAPHAPPDAVPVGNAPAPTGKRREAVTGELSTEVALRQPEAPAEPPPPKRNTAQPPPGAGSQPRGGFRETMWFFKGEVESAMAAEGGEDAPQASPPEESPDELTRKYADDGSLNDDEARRLSLRTGNTQMMQQVHVPSGHVPGKKMEAEDFIVEMNRTRRVITWLGILVLLAGLAALVTWLVIS